MNTCWPINVGLETLEPTLKDLRDAWVQRKPVSKRHEVFLLSRLFFRWAVKHAPDKKTQAKNLAELSDKCETEGQAQDLLSSLSAQSAVAVLNRLSHKV